MAINNKLDNLSAFKYTMESAPGVETIIDGNKYLYFAGTGYYQLQSHPEVVETAQKAIAKYGMGSATSRAITGTTPLLLELETLVSRYFNTEDAVYLPSGYLSNIAGLQALDKMGKFDVLFVDEASHYCLIEAAKIISKPTITFKNRNPEDLQFSLNSNLKPGQKPAILSDGMFPIWAKIAPIPEYLALAEQYNGIVWIDDAHPVGILGNNGRGTYDYFNIKSDRLYMGATLSKAFGAYGGIITGDSEFIYAVKTGNVVTGSSAPLSAAAAAAIKGIELVMLNSSMRKKLWKNAEYLKSRIKELGTSVDNNYFPIVTFSLDSVSKMEMVHAQLMKKGIYIQYAKYKGSGENGVLRIVVFSTHTKEHIDYLVDSLKEVL